MPSGFIYINKPRGISSFSVIYRLRKITGVKRIGHAGTLDPEADGLLIAAVGRDYTKKLSQWLKNDKEYAATIKLGFISETGDAEGPITEKNPSLKPLKKEVLEALKKFTGEIDQVPPKHSALKVNGKRAYERARAGETVIMASRKVKIYKLELLEYNYPELRFRASVSTGTYIRTLAEDIGMELGIGAYLSALTRTKIDGVSIKEAVELDQLDSDNWTNYLHE